MMKCGQCALKTLEGGMCPIFHQEMSADTGACPMFTTELITCDVCGAIIPKGAIIQEENELIHILCSNCATSGCAACVENQYCAFEQDTSCAEQPFIMETVQKGNAIFQTQRRNPKRIEATCAQGCPCYLPKEKLCLRQFGRCINHKINWRN